MTELRAWPDWVCTTLDQDDRHRLRFVGNFLLRKYLVFPEKSISD